METNITSLIISQEDFQKISALLPAAKPELAELLQEELQRAELVPAEQLPPDTVAMNSEVTYRDLGTGKEQTVTLTYPHEADIEKNRVSILAPVGAALIGLSVGQTIEWPLDAQRVKHLQVTSVARAS